MKSLFLILISLFFIDNSFPQVSILFYDFESNTNRSVFENSVELNINPGSGPLVRHGAGTIYGDIGYNNGRAIFSNNWQNVTSDPGLSATDYYEFKVNTSGFKGISIMFRYSIPFQSGPGSIGLLVSSNGTTFKKIWLISPTPNSGFSAATTDLYDYPEVNNNANLIMRLYAFKGGNTQSGGIMGLDNLEITADTILANAGNITLVNEKDLYNCYYSGGKGKTLLNYNLTVNGPGTTISLSSPLDITNNITINKGAVLVCGNYQITGVGSFTLNSGGTLSIGSPGNYYSA